MGHILLILKEPFLDRIPSLKTLILNLCENNHVTIITTKSHRFEPLTTTHAHIRSIYVRERSSKFELPTTIKLTLKVLSFLLSNKPEAIIGGDLWGNVIASKLKPFYSCPHIFFALEFPQIKTTNHPVLMRHEVMENDALQKANFIITHDEFHKNFICENFKVKEDIVFKLANASFTPEFTEHSDFIRRNFGISSNKTVVLHSGGFGVWFKCKELADISKDWKEDKQLIFHIGRKPSGTTDFDYIYDNSEYKDIIFSLSPLPNEDLDKMIASADVGIALYSIEALGYRAELMGLAAGKIGNYLKCGLPVIASRMSSLSYIEDYHCGILVESETEIEAAIERIMKNRDCFRENAFRCYRELWHPSNYLGKIIHNVFSI